MGITATFYTRAGSLILPNVVMANRSAALNIAKFRVSQDAALSDHAGIEVEYPTKMQNCFMTSRSIRIFVVGPHDQETFARGMVEESWRLNQELENVLGRED